MSRLVKIVNNKYIQIEEYRNPNICFNTSEYNDFEDYCTLRETFDPFEIFYENQELKEKLDKYENPEDMTLMMMWCTEKVKDENEKLKKQLENKYEKVGTLTSELLYEENTKLVEENQKLKQVNEEHRMLNGQLREDIKTKDKAYKSIVEELTEYAEENERLKLQLSGTTFCYDEKEHRDLKAKIKELERIIELCHLDAKETLATINYEQENQQKEFIKFLEDEWAKHEYISAHEIDDNIRHTEEKIRSNIFEILQKYKSVIGDDK